MPRSKVPEAKLVQTEAGLLPQGEGWYVLNAREARWWHTDELGSSANFEGDVRFSEFGINVHVLLPGQPSCMYHGENAQEDFLVLAGECLILVEGEERLLKAWDFVHCPPWTEHVFIGAGTDGCVVLMVGTRKVDEEIVYPVDEVAQRHGAGVDEETSVPAEAYARFPSVDEGPYREGSLRG